MNGEAYEREDDSEVSGELPYRSGAGAHTPPPGYRAIPTRTDPAAEPAERFNYLEPVRRTPAEAYPYPAAAPDEPYEPPSLTRPVHHQPAFGRPTYDQEARRTAYEQERDSGSWSSAAAPRSRLWDEPAALTQEPEVDSDR